MAHAIYRVEVIERLVPGRKKHSGSNYLVLARSPSEAREMVADHLGEWIAPIYVGNGVALSVGPIAFTHYSLDQKEVEVRINRKNANSTQGSTP